MSKTRPPEGADAGSAVRARDYIPQDRMFLFWLRDPAALVLVGALYDLGLVEHATMTLARLAGLDPAQTRPIDLGGGRGHAIAVRRFDRLWTGDNGPARRDHAMSLHSAMRATGSDFSYPNFALHLRRYAAAQDALAMERTLFRRMVFNILMDNTDDHEKNHALVFGDSAAPRLAPAFDMLPMCQNRGYQQIGVRVKGSESSLENAMSAHRAFRLSKQQAQAEISAVARMVDGWRMHFERVGVGARDIELLSASIDRHFLADQRKWAVRLGDEGPQAFRQRHSR
jgi:serine/threonine-protein kinase HipA